MVVTPQTQAAAQPSQSQPAVVRPEPEPVIHGLERIQANGSAIGVSNEQPVVETQQSAPTNEQGTEKPEGSLESPLTLEDKLKDPELLEYITREKARVVTAAQKEWDQKTLQKRLAADRQQREEAIRELAIKAESGDEEALKELGKTVQAQVLRKTTVQEFAQAWFTEADETVNRLFGADPNIAAQLHVTNFGKVADWVEAMVNARVQVAVSAEKGSFQKELDRLAEAKAAELVTARRQNLPVPDLTAPVAGGGSPRKWNTFSEAANLYANEEISDDEMLEARRLLALGTLAPGQYTDY